MEIINVTEAILRELYEDSALTWEGLKLEDDTLDQIKEWLEEHDAKLLTNNVYLTKGKLMNEIFNLKGNDKYPDDLSIVSLKLEDIENVQNIFVARFEVRGRWMDDIICNLIDSDWSM